MTAHEIAKLAAICFVVFGAAILIVYGLFKRFPVQPEEVYSIRDKFPQVLNGEVVTPIMDDYRMQCCDCGLIHRMRFRALKVKKHLADGTWGYDELDPRRYRVQLTAWREDATPNTDSRNNPAESREASC